jgi:hypothetical protein
MPTRTYAIYVGRKSNGSIVYSSFTQPTPTAEQALTSVVRRLGGAPEDYAVVLLTDETLFNRISAKELVTLRVQETNGTWDLVADFSQEDNVVVLSPSFSSNMIQYGNNVTITVTASRSVNVSAKIPINTPIGNALLHLDFVDGIATRTINLSHFGRWIIPASRTNTWKITEDATVNAFI